MKPYLPLILLGLSSGADLRAHDLMHGQFTPYVQRHANPDRDQSGYPRAGFSIPRSASAPSTAGWPSISDDDPLHHQLTVGGRYTIEELTDQGAGDQTANGAMLFAGWLF